MVLNNVNASFDKSTVFVVFSNRAFSFAASVGRSLGAQRLRLLHRGLRPDHGGLGAVGAVRAGCERSRTRRVVPVSLGALVPAMMHL